MAAAAALIGWRWSNHRGSAVGAAVMAATTTLVITRRLSPTGLAAPLAGAAGIVSIMYLLRARMTSPDRRVGALAIGALGFAGVATLFVYLSVPDTESAVLLGAVIGGATLAWAVGRWRFLPLDAAVGVGAALGAVGFSAAAGIRRPWSPAGWWVAKVVLALGFATAVFVLRRRVTSGPAHRSR